MRQVSFFGIFALVVVLLMALAGVGYADKTITITQPVIISGTTYTTGNVTVDDNTARQLVNDGKATYSGTAPTAQNVTNFAAPKITATTGNITTVNATTVNASGLSKFSAGISPNGTNTATIPAQTGTIKFTAGLGSLSVYTAPTVSTTFTSADCGKTIGVGTDALTHQIPAATSATVGCRFRFINVGAAGNNIVDIKAGSSDAFYGTLYNPGVTGPVGTVVTSSTGSTLSNTKATAKKGDHVDLEYTAANMIIITDNTGTWTTK